MNNQEITNYIIDKAFAFTERFNEVADSTLSDEMKTYVHAKMFNDFANAFKGGFENE